MAEDEVERLRGRKAELTAEVERLRAALVRATIEPLQAERDRDRIWDLSPVFKLVATLDGTINAANPRWTSCLGWTASDTVDRNVSQFVVAEDLPAAREVFAALARDGLITDHQIGFVTRDGGRRRTTWTTVNEDGVVYAFGRDVTDQVRAEEALR